jgi:hypothetical protein
MIVCEHMNFGTHSASAVVHEARKYPCLRHAVRTLPRDWWRNAVQERGADYSAVYVPHGVCFRRFGVEYEIGAHETVVFSRSSNADWDFYYRLLDLGGVKRVVTLVHPPRVLNLVAREVGLECRLCGEHETTDFWNWRSAHICRKCEARMRKGRRRDAGPASYALRLLETEIRRHKRGGEQDCASAEQAEAESPLEATAGGGPVH